METKRDLSIEEEKDGVLLHVRAQPRASRPGLRFSEDGRLRIAVAAPPVDNAANEAIRVYLAQLFGVAKRNVSIASGERSRNKTVRIAHLPLADATARLDDYQKKGK